MNFRSIKAKILLALLALSLLPLLFVVPVGRSGMVDLIERVEAELKQNAEQNLVQLARDQATIADAMLSRVEAETEMVAFAAERLLRSPRLANSSELTLTDAMYTLAPDLPLAAARPELARYSPLEALSARIRAGNPNIESIYVATASGIYLESPGSPMILDSPVFTLKAEAFEAQLAEGVVSDEVWQAFVANKLALSRQSRVAITEPGRKWLVRDLEQNRIFSVRRTGERLDVFGEYDARIRPWYRNAARGQGAAWTKYPNWNRGERIFALDPATPIGARVTIPVAQAFADHQIALVEHDPITIELSGQWRLQDKNGKNYEVRKESGGFNVYSTDILTCARAVPDPQGALTAVVAADISMHSISRRIIHTPENIQGSAFLLNERGQLIEQEHTRMFVPDTDGLRRQMTAGATGIAYDADSTTYVAYAPIRSIHSPDEKAYWSLGIVVSEQEVTGLVDQIERDLVALSTLLAAIVGAMILLVTYAAFRIARGITGPILALEQGAKRIGSGDLEHRLEVRTGDEIEALADTFNSMAGDLATYIKDLKETAAQKERFESELRVAHEIQMSFLKKIFPPFPTRGDFSLFASLEPAREVGGDLYDFSLLDEHRLAFYVGDVSDKGVPASLVMAMTMTLMKRSCQQAGITPAGILRQVNAALAEGNESAMFVTLFIGILDVKTGELSFSNAGHNPPLILQPDGQCRYLPLPDGLVLGVMADAEYSDAIVQLGAGDMIVTYTDGVTEAMNNQRALYSEERLQETLTSLAGRNVEETVAGIFASVRAHADGAPPSDDIAVLALQRK